jgi:hypothetical protein
MVLSGLHKHDHNENGVSTASTWHRINVTNVTLHVRDDATAYITSQKLMKFKIKTGRSEETVQE